MAMAWTALLRIPAAPWSTAHTLTPIPVEYVSCKICKSPDTVLGKDNRLYFLTCESCGSKRSVQTIKAGYKAQVDAYLSFLISPVLFIVLTVSTPSPEARWIVGEGLAVYHMHFLHYNDKEKPADAALRSVVSTDTLWYPYILVGP